MVQSIVETKEQCLGSGFDPIKKTGFGALYLKRREILKFF